MPPGTLDSEVEAKLLAERDSDLDTLSRVTQLGAYPLRPHAPHHLHSVYFDSKDLALARHGVALRLRQGAGGWEVTMKWAGDVDGLIHSRPELTLPIAPPQGTFVPPPDLEVYLAAVRAGRRLAPILVTDIDRRTLDVLDPGGARCLAEIALDRVHLHGPHTRDARSERYCEIEIERKEGTPDDVATITALIRHRRRLHPSPDTKLARGLRLLYGSGTLGAPPHPNALRLDDPAEFGIRKIMRVQIERLLANDPGTRIGEDVEALHDMRVACRRLRALLHLFGDTVPPRTLRALGTGLRWLGQVLGRVRDVDVHLQRLESSRGEMRGVARVAFDPYLEYLHALRASRRSTMLEELSTPRYFRLLRTLDAFAYATTAASGDDTIAATGRRAIRKAAKKLRKRARAIGPQPAPEDLHTVRILAKRLRYACEFLQPLTGPAGARFIKRLVKLQDLLGAHNDAVTASAFVHAYVGDAHCPPATEHALTRFVRVNDTHAADARAGFHRAWDEFTRRRTQKQFAAMLTPLAG